MLAGLHRAPLAYYPQTFITVLFLLLYQVPEGHRLTMATGPRDDIAVVVVRKPHHSFGIKDF